MSSPEAVVRPTGADAWPWSALAKAVALGAVTAVVVNVVIALVARGVLGASSAFQPLTPQVFVPLTVIGTAFGGLGWLLVRRSTRRPARVLRRLVPSVLVVSFVPDLLVLAGDMMPGTGTTAVLALMLMHVAVTAAAVPAYQRFLPVDD